ncbi:hypothetical protein [Bradyrhizobium sp. cf659]|uniref:hypothetical protein n=1 Tax=Bradyrhizobium sp. cf659 TaxID=1761771 RepID=UPI00116027C1|nr:hypothetical protein [Bradyrhizobium sp. cf659]
MVSVVLWSGTLGVSSVYFVREFPLVLSALAEEQSQGGTRTGDQENHGGGDQSDRQDRVPARRPPFGTFVTQDDPEVMQAWLWTSAYYGLISLLSVLVAGVAGFVFVRRRRDE